MAGSAIARDTGNALVLNNMQGKPLPVPATSTIRPGEELGIRMELRMHAGMDGPHLFRLRLPVAGPEGVSQPPLELYVRGVFG